MIKNSSIEINHEIFVCDCSDISHQLILTTWNFKDGNTELELSVKLNSFHPWHKRILLAFKYIFKMDCEHQFDVVLMNDLNIKKLQDSLENYKKIQTKALIEDYKF